MAKRARPDVIAAESRKPMTAEERYEKHYPLIRAARLTLDEATQERKSANSTYTNALKAFKKDGGNTEMLVKVMSDAKREVDEIERDIRDYNAYARLIGLPIGTQLGLFADGTTVASKVDEDRIAEQSPQKDGFTEGRPISSEKSIAEAKARGFEDGAEGRTKRIYEDGSPEALAYDAEYHRGQLVIADKFGGGSDQPKPKRKNGAHHAAA